MGLFFDFLVWSLTPPAGFPQSPPPTRDVGGKLGTIAAGAAIAEILQVG